MIINNVEIEVLTSESQARLVYGTKTLRWYLVGPTDRDYLTGISCAKFRLQSEEDSRLEYLAPSKV